MVQGLIEKLRGDLKYKDNELWKMTNEKEQYRGKAEAGSTTVKSQQVLFVCVTFVIYASIWIQDRVCMCMPALCVCTYILCEHFKFYDYVHI